jgi:hypothetical protein
MMMIPTTPYADTRDGWRHLAEQHYKEIIKQKVRIDSLNQRYNLAVIDMKALLERIARIEGGVGV